MCLAQRGIIDPAKDICWEQSGSRNRCRNKSKLMACFKLPSLQCKWTCRPGTAKESRVAKAWFFAPIKVTGMFKTRGKLGNGFPSTSHSLALHSSVPYQTLAEVIRGGVRWRAGKERREKVPLSPKHCQAAMWSVGKGTLLGPIMSCPHYKLRCRSEQHPLNNAHITMTTTEFDTWGQLYCACEISSF